MLKPSPLRLAIQSTASEIQSGLKRAVCGCLPSANARTSKTAGSGSSCQRATICSRSRRIASRLASCIVSGTTTRPCFCVPVVRGDLRRPGCCHGVSGSPRRVRGGGRLLRRLLGCRSRLRGWLRHGRFVAVGCDCGRFVSQAGGARHPLVDREQRYVCGPAF